MTARKWVTGAVVAAAVVFGAASIARGLSWTYTEAVRAAPGQTITYRIWIQGNASAVLVARDPDGAVQEERRCSQGRLRHVIPSVSDVERSDLSQDDCVARVTDPLLGLSRRIADLGLSGAVIGETSNGHPLVEYVMPAAYEAYSKVVVDSVTGMPVHAVLRSGGEVTWAYQVTENADPPPEPETGTSADVYEPLDLRRAAELFGATGIPGAIGQYTLVNAQTARFSSRSGPTHGVIWRDDNGRELQVVLDVDVAVDPGALGLEATNPADVVFRAVHQDGVLGFYGPDAETVVSLVRELRPDLVPLLQVEVIPSNG